MSQVMMDIPFNAEGFDAFLKSRNEPEWLSERRRQAWSTFEAKAWPTQKDEEWIRTDIRLFHLDRFGFGAPPEPCPLSLDDSLLGRGVELGGHVLSCNGHTVDSRVSSALTEKGVVFGSLAELVKSEHGARIQELLLQRAVHPDLDRFSALHSAFWSSGSVLYVPRGQVIDQPVLSMSVLAEGGTDMGHILVILDDDAEATVLSEQRSVDENGKGMHCGAIELIVGKSSRLRFVNLQDWGKGVWHFAHQKALVDRDASLQWTAAAMGGRLAKVNQHVGLVAEGANCQVNGVLFTEDKQHLSYHTLQHHEAPHCTSDFLYKAALQDKSRTVWRGMIKVDPEAQRTDGYQRNDNLLLSQKSRADSIPGLEIEADDVRCTHGSTSGRVDDELIFYAQCRGYTRKEAIRMIVNGFFQQVFDRITIESVREALGEAIGRRVRDYE